MSTTRRSLKLYVAGLAIAAAGAFTLTAQAQPYGPGGGGPGHGPGYGPGACAMGGGYGHGPMMGGWGGHGRGQGPMMGSPGGYGPGAGGQGPGAGLYMSERMLDFVKATPEQRTALRKIAQDAAADMQAQRNAGRALRDQMAQLLSQPTVDTGAVEALRQQMSAHHDQASKKRTQAMLEASKVLTPEQRKLIADTAKARSDMHERHRRERQTLEAPKS